jgi:hypothetical protein
VLNNISDTTPVDAMPDRSAEVQTRSSTGPSRDGCGKHPVDPHGFGSTISSGRLFLDQVARQQSPSPLHRHEQINTHSATNLAKEDIFTLPARGHFYFALTNDLELLGVGPVFG